MKIFAAASLSALFVLSACSAGSGTVGVDPMGHREDPGGQGRDTPSGTRDPSSAASGEGTGGGAAGGGGCIACDRNYQCDGVVEKQNVSVILTLKTINGQCTSNGSVIACGGTILDDKGKPSGTSWTRQGSGFVVNGPKGESVSCTPTDKPAAPTKSGTTTPGSTNG